MAGIFGVVGSENCGADLFLGTFYLQHRAQDYCGLMYYIGDETCGDTHKGLLGDSFNEDDLSVLRIDRGIGSVSVTREPRSGLSRYQGRTITFDGNVHNNQTLRDNLLRNGSTFFGCHFPEQISDIDLVSEVVLGEPRFENGIERLFEVIEGDFAIVALAREGVYAARGYGRKPLVLGKKQGDRGESYAVSSESTSFINTGFKIERDVNPGEIVFLDKSGIHHVKQIDLGDMVRFGTFEWIYTAYPTSVIDGKSVSEVRKRMGGLLARAFPVEADVVSPIPNSGRWHAIGFGHKAYADGFNLPYEEVFIRYDYAGRSFTPGDGKVQQKIADRKLIPNQASIRDKRIVIVDDSIVRGTQTKNQVQRLKQCGAKEVHARIACPPLMASCPYGKSTSKDEDCVARRMSIEDIRVSRGLDSLKYASVEMLEQAIGFSRDQLCLTCWNC